MVSLAVVAWLVICFVGWATLIRSNKRNFTLVSVFSYALFISGVVVILTIL